MNIDTIKEMIKEKLLEALKNEAAKPDFPDIDGDGDREEPISKAAKDKKQKQNEEQEIFAPNHYCVHHGGVQHNGSVQMAEAVSHNYNKELGRVTHYDMKLEDGTILEGVAAEDIQVTNASLANEHMHAVRDDDEKDEVQEADLTEKRLDPKNMSDEELKTMYYKLTTIYRDPMTGKDLTLSPSEKAYAETFAQEFKKRTGKHPRDSRPGSRFANRSRVTGQQPREGKIQTPEQENLLYESRFEERDTDLFNRLVNKWIK